MLPTSIFLCHNSQDKDFARKLTTDLKSAGIIVWFDEAEIKIGDSIIEKIGGGISASQYIGIILSPTSVNSNWVKTELQIAIYSQIINKNKTVLPILFKDCKIPTFLTGIAYADFRDEKQYSLVIRQLLNRFDPRFAHPHFVTSQELQELLDQIPNPPKQHLFQARTDAENIEFVYRYSVDVSELELRMSWEKCKLYSALRELIKSKKIEIFIFKGVISGGHSSIPLGTPIILPMVFKGLLPPSLRSLPEEIEILLKNLERE